jgi:glycosyltransferase involved in cell wall biosynthesis
MNQPFVSIITPAYNSAQFLRETIESVINQDYPHIEHIIIDGSSSDGTLDILKSYPNIKWISEPDRGQSQAINKGFTMAHGDILGWINADDTYEPDAVSAAVQTFITNPNADLVYSDMRIITQEGATIRIAKSMPFVLDQLLSLNFIRQSTVFIRSRVIQEIGGVNENLHYCMDREFWLRIGTKYTYYYQPGHIAANFRVHPKAKSSGDVSRFHAEWMRVMEDALTDPRYDQISYSKKKKAIMQASTRMHFTQIIESIQMKNFRKATYYIWQLIYKDWKYIANYIVANIGSLHQVIRRMDWGKKII